MAREVADGRIGPTHRRISLDRNKRRRVAVAAAFFAAFTATALAVRWPGSGKARSKAEHSAPRPIVSLDAGERAPELLQIYRDSLRPGADEAYRKVEDDAASVCAELGFPNPHLALESLTGSKEVWWLNAFPSEDARKRVASDYAGNRPLVEALEGIAKRKEGLVSAPVDQLGRYRQDLSGGAVWDPSGARFVVAIVRTHAAEAGAAVFETSDGTFFVLRPARSREEAETLARAAGPEARLFAVRPNWGMPAKAWASADPDFWKPNPAAGRR